jgi:hypothetical protein
VRTDGSSSSDSTARTANLRWHRFARDVVLAGTGLATMPEPIASALAQPSPEGFAVPL